MYHFDTPLGNRWDKISKHSPLWYSTGTSTIIFNLQKIVRKHTYVFVTKICSNHTEGT